MEGLHEKLLLVHGSGDDNGHYQGTELLVNRLVELGKPFDFMTYPGRTHAIVEGPGSRFHLYRLLPPLLGGTPSPAFRCPGNEHISGYKMRHVRLPWLESKRGSRMRTC